MSREDRWIVSLSEIHNVRWQCPECHVVISFAFAKPISLPDSCPTCKAELVDPSLDTPAAHRFKALQGFVDALRAARSLSDDNGAGAVRLEFLTQPPKEPELK